MLVELKTRDIDIPATGKRKVAVLGSTGSIGTSALEVLHDNQSNYHVFALVAGSNGFSLGEQVARFGPRYAALQDKLALSKLLSDQAANRLNGTKFVHGAEEIAQLAAHHDVDIVLAAIVGFDCLAPVVSAIKSNKQIALANKESIVCAGALLEDLLQHSGACIIPVDSEHSAIFQALRGDQHSDIASLTLTASGGPFLDFSASQLRNITPAQAVKHPRWNMGAKISIDSATMMNKALELIEAHWLFGIDANNIKVVVHPQSIVHSLASFVDGSCLAQLSVPDMKGPIAYALSYPGKRLSNVMPTLELDDIRTLEFRTLDDDRFPAVSLARHCLNAGGALPAVLNLANELAVAMFMREQITFDRIVPMVEEALSKWSGVQYGSIDDLFALREQICAQLGSD